MSDIESPQPSFLPDQHGGHGLNTNELSPPHLQPSVNGTSTSQSSKKIKDASRLSNTDNEETPLIKKDVDQQQPPDEHPLLTTLSNLPKKPEPQSWWEIIQECWNFNNIYKEIFIRDRGEDLYPLDCVRAWAYIWVSAYHIFECLSNYYGVVSLENAFGNYVNLFIYGGANGVVSFFVLSGFLIPYIFLSISKKNKDGNCLSLKSIVTFLVRRYLRIAPSLYFTTLVVWFYGCYNPNGTNSTSYDYCTGCSKAWYENFLFIANICTGGCWHSTWTVSNEMQFYLCSIPIMWVYIANKWAGIAFTATAMYCSWYIRNHSFRQANNEVYDRIDQYGAGIMLFFM